MMKTAATGKSLITTWDFRIFFHIPWAPYLRLMLLNKSSRNCCISEPKQKIVSRGSKVSARRCHFLELWNLSVRELSGIQKRMVAHRIWGSSDKRWKKKQKIINILCQKYFINSRLTEYFSFFYFSVQNFGVQTGVDVEKPVQGSEADHEVRRPWEKLLRMKNCDELTGEERSQPTRRL